MPAVCDHCWAILMDNTCTQDVSSLWADLLFQHHFSVHSHGWILWDHNNPLSPCLCAPEWTPANNERHWVPGNTVETISRTLDQDSDAWACWGASPICLRGITTLSHSPLTIVPAQLLPARPHQMQREEVEEYEEMGNPALPQCL